MKDSTPHSDRRSARDLQPSVDAYGNGTIDFELWLMLWGITREEYDAWSATFQARSPCFAAHS